MNNAIWQENNKECNKDKKRVGRTSNTRKKRVERNKKPGMH